MFWYRITIMNIIRCNKAKSRLSYKSLVTAAINVLQDSNARTTIITTFSRITRLGFARTICNWTPAYNGVVRIRIGGTKIWLGRWNDRTVFECRERCPRLCGSWWDMGTGPGLTTVWTTRTQHNCSVHLFLVINSVGLQVLNRRNPNKPTIPYQGEAPNNCKLTTEFLIQKPEQILPNHTNYIWVLKLLKLTFKDNNELIAIKH